MNDKQVRQDIIAALDWDPSIDSANVGVAVNDGVAVLSGHVANYIEKLTAEATAKRVKGVRGIANEVEVRYAGSPAPTTDEDLAGRALQSLKWNAAIPRDRVQVSVTHGLIKLSGEVEWDYQRRAAETTVRRLVGVMGVVNGITLKTRVTPTDITQRIEAALKRDAVIEADRVHVSVVEGVVTLEGAVHSWHERDAVERAVWAAPGVRSVKDRVHVG